MQSQVRDSAVRRDVQQRQRGSQIVGVLRIRAPRPVRMLATRQRVICQEISVVMQREMETSSAQSTLSKPPSRPAKRSTQSLLTLRPIGVRRGAVGSPVTGVGASHLPRPQPLRSMKSEVSSCARPASAAAQSLHRRRRPAGGDQTPCRRPQPTGQNLHLPLIFSPTSTDSLKHSLVSEYKQA